MLEPQNPKRLSVNPALAGIALFAAAGAGAMVGVIAGSNLAETETQVAPPVAPDGNGPAPALPTTPGNLADLVAGVLPAVVQVQVKQTVIEDAGSGFPDAGPFGDLYRRFFGDRGSKPRRHVEEGLGSGFVIDTQGHIVTNNHVIDGATEVTVRLSDGRELVAKVIGRDEKTDLAVVKVSGKLPAAPLAWGSSDRMRIGDAVFAAGSPFGLGGTVTAGIISGRGREIGQGPYDDFIQVDAPINRGNSGGPLFDGAGRVIGVNTAIYSPSGGSVGIGFAIPASIARDVIRQLIEKGEVVRGQIGVQIQTVTPEIADSLGIENVAGALVAGVQPGSPADAAGVRPGDIVTGFNGAPVKTGRDLSRAVAALAIGKSTTITVVRDGKPRDLTISIGKPKPQPRREARAQLPDMQDAPQATALGLDVVPANPEINRQAGHPANARGVVVTSVEDGSEAADRGIEAGDLISAVNGQRVQSPGELTGSLNRARNAGRRHVLLEVVRSGERYFVAVPLGR